MKTLPVLDERATGIDVGSEKLHVSIGGDTPRVFDTMTQDVATLVDWLRDQRVHSVAMEATGVYWLYLYGALEAAGITVLVANGRQVRNLPGRKTDMADCQWLATLHAHGLLHSGFVPPAEIRQLQDYLRLRQDHITMAASHVQHMQKALERMNIKFHAVISDLTGVSGLKVIEAILAGQRDPAYLLSLCDVQIRKHKADRVQESLRGMWKHEHLFALRQALQSWKHYQGQISECDRAIEQVLRTLSGPPRDDGPASPAKPGGTHTPAIDGLHRMLLQLCGGNDPTQLPGLADYSLLQVIGEVGTDLRRWPSEKHFTAWTGLAPGTHQSGKRHRQQSRHRNRAGQLFCQMARSLANSVDKALGGFYRRLKARRGGLVANKALARKLAALFWQTMVNGTDYVEQGLRRYQARAAQSEQHVLRKLAQKHGLDLVPAKTRG
ncbi:IS110 family transposase [Cupriavidus taiwanensis]|uniref:IS110 family transposase n=1 Tax=Cupriavidus taiwanensis TaxID=164546 RepID=UPI002541442A|nr:IS110 family transposase [Cupriavidus taiwanensis]MDK3026620.1 IS110 family transposase [Cupriavidus taiwanensis]